MKQSNLRGESILRSQKKSIFVFFHKSIVQLIENMFLKFRAKLEILW